MKYKCVNELDKFGFQDAGVISFDYRDGMLSLELEGMIAKYDNPHNQKYEDCYISAAQIRFKGAKILTFFLEGAKYYDANDVLLEEVPDTDILPEAYRETIGRFKQGVIFMVREKAAVQDGARGCMMAVDVEEDTYWIEITYEKVVIEWDRFMNKVQS